MKSQTFIIAEAGVNHNGDIAIARQLIDVAKKAGADAVKFQSFCAEDLVCAHAPKAAYQKISDQHDSQLQMLKSLELSQESQLALHEYCQQKNILFLSSPFDLKSVNFLDKNIHLPIFKIPSGEITHLPLLLKIARTGKKVILSTGMSTLAEIETALSILAYGYLYAENNDEMTYEECYFSDVGQKILQEKVSLLHCVTEYPAPLNEVNLQAISLLAKTFGLPVGYSDHTVGIAVAIASIACGATIIEKHFTLDKSMQGPDHAASLEPNELEQMILGIRQVELALGQAKKLPTISEIKNRKIARKSLVAATKINKGEKFTEKNLTCKRPGDGISPVKYFDYTNKMAERDYDKDELIS